MMRGQARQQLVLCLELEQRPRPIEHPPDGLVQALADLLLEALGEEVKEQANTEERADEPQDHG
jgi:hypothetical protein